MCLIQTILFLWIATSAFAFEPPPVPVYDPKVQKCVSGFCLPMDYKRLEAPIKDSHTTVKIETEIMDVLQVKILNLFIYCFAISKYIITEKD